MNTTLSYLWGIYEEPKLKAYYISVNNNMYRVTVTPEGACVVGDNGREYRFNTLEMALRNLFHRDSNTKVLWDFDKENNCVVPVKMSGATSKDLIVEKKPVFKKWFIGILGDEAYFLGVNAFGKVQLYSSGISQSLENRTGKYYNIIGDSGKIVPRNKEVRKFANDECMYPPCMTDKFVQWAITVIAPTFHRGIKAYTSKAMIDFENYTINNKRLYGITKSETGVCRRYPMLKFYGHFGRYKSSIAVIDAICSVFDDARKSMLMYSIEKLTCAQFIDMFACCFDSGDNNQTNLVRWTRCCGFDVLDNAFDLVWANTCKEYFKHKIRGRRTSDSEVMYARYVKLMEPVRSITNKFNKICEDNGVTKQMRIAFIKKTPWGKNMLSIASVLKLYTELSAKDRMIYLKWLTGVTPDIDVNGNKTLESMLKYSRLNHNKDVLVDCFNSLVHFKFNVDGFISDYNLSHMLWDVEKGYSFIINNLSSRVSENLDEAILSFVPKDEVFLAFDKMVTLLEKHYNLYNGRYHNLEYTVRDYCGVQKYKDAIYDADAYGYQLFSEANGTKLSREVQKGYKTWLRKHMVRYCFTMYKFYVNGKKLQTTPYMKSCNNNQVLQDATLYREIENCSDYDLRCLMAICMYLRLKLYNPVIENVPLWCKSPYGGVASFYDGKVEYDKSIIDGIMMSLKNADIRFSSKILDAITEEFFDEWKNL